MRSINKVYLIGNLTRDPEMRQTSNGQYVATFGLATNREWVTKDGRKLSSSEFHELVCWARLASLAHEHLKKGKLIYVEGYLKTRAWDDSLGVKKFKTEIIVEDLIMLDKKKTSGTPELMTMEQEGPRSIEEELPLSEEEQKNPLGTN